MWRGVQPAERRFRAAVCALAVFAGLHGLVYVPFAGHRLGDTADYVAAAQAIRHGSYTTHLGAVDVTDLTIPPAARGAPERQTYRTPGYPLLLAATGGGGGGAPTWAIIATQAVLIGAAAALLTLLARRLWGERTALLAGALFALDPFTKHYVTRILTECLAILLVALMAYTFVRAWQQRSTAWWGATGLAAAALILTRPVFLLALLVLAVAGVLQQRRVRARLRGLAALTAGALVLLGPWLAWTDSATGRPVLKSFAAGWNLLLAAHGEGLRHTAAEVQASPAFRRDFLSVHRRAASANALRNDPTAHPHYLVRADAQQRRRAWDVYQRRLSRAPLAVAGETLYRAYFLWEAHEDWVQPGWLLALLRALDWLSIALAVAGIALTLRRGGPARALGVLLLVFTAVNAVSHVEARYSMPVRGLELAFIALALATLAVRLRAWRLSR